MFKLSFESLWGGIEVVEEKEESKGNVKEEE